MAVLSFKNLDFKENGSKVEVILMGGFSFDIEKTELESIAPFRTGKNSIEFDGIDERKARQRFDFLIARNIQNLKNKLNKRPAVYVHQNSGIPLLGSLAFGIVDKGSDMVEVKPITGCELNCLFCSVGEGISGKKQTDFVVEAQYIIDELKRLLDFKAHKGMRIFINPHGEPLLYADIVDLVDGISKIEWVESVAIITNGSRLTKELADKLVDAGLSQINISMNAFSQQTAGKLAGIAQYELETVKKMAEYLGRNIKVVIAPVWLNGVNDKDIEDIVVWAKNHDFDIGIQKFCENKRGRNPIKEATWEEFELKMKELETKHGIQLLQKGDINHTKELPKPFAKGDIVKAQIICDCRNKNEKLAVAKERVISVPGCQKNGSVKVKIVQDKHNIYIGKIL